MKHIIAIFFSGILFTIGIYSLYKPLGRDLIPRIAPFFIGESGIWGTIKKSTEKEQDTLRIKGINSNVAIARDAFGTPHIFAESYEDALFGLGFITAKDRMFQVDWASRIVSGGLSEWFGSSYVETDKYLLNIGLNQVASETMRQVANTNEYELLRIYSNGINAYINEYYEKTMSFEYALLGLPVRYHRPVDGIKAMIYFHFLMNWNIDDFFIQKIVDTIGEEAFQHVFFKHVDYTLSATGKPQHFEKKPHSVQTQSNPYSNLLDWFEKQSLVLETKTGIKPHSFSGNIITTNSQTGKRLLTANLNGPLTQPTLFYEVYFHLADKKVFHGFTIPGIPGLLFGNNNKIAWALNNSPVDVIDFSLKPEDFTDFKEISSSIDIREAESINYPVRYTQDGTLFYSANEIVEMHWPSLRGATFANELKDAMFSQNIEELYQNLKNANLPVTTVVAIDEQETGIFFSGKIPKREPYLGISFSNSAQSTTKFWSNQLNRISHKNVVVLTNQFPEIVIPENFPYFNREGFWRNNRLIELVNQQPMIKTVKDVEVLLSDYKMQEEELKPIFTELFKGKLSSPINSLGNALRDWNYLANKDSGYPKYFSNLEKIVKSMTFDEFPVRFYPDNESIYILIRKEPWNPIFDIKTTSETENATDVLYKAMNSALELSVLESGSPENWIWANSNRADIKHISNNRVLNQLNDLAVIREGFFNTVNKTVDGVFPVAQIIRFSAWSENNEFKSKGLLFSGISANRYSTNYDNQLSLWATGESKPSFNLVPIDSLKKFGYVYIKPNK